MLAWQGALSIRSKNQEIPGGGEGEGGGGRNNRKVLPPIQPFLPGLSFFKSGN